MPIMYLDESGDLGFGDDSSPIFVIAAVVFEDPKMATRIVKRIRNRKLPGIGTAELKWHQSSEEVREEMVRRLGQEDVDIGYAAILKKKQVSERLRRKQTKLYNYLAYQVIRWLANRRRGRTCQVIIDRSIYGFAEQDINRYIESDGYRQVVTEWGGQLVLTPSELNVDIQHRDSNEEAGLQIADFVAGSVNHYWKSGRDDKYFHHIKRRVCGEFLFPKEKV